LQEIQAVCQRIIVINEGALVADSSLSQMRESGMSLEEIFLHLISGGSLEPYSGADEGAEA
jgi:ABC-2 type transport system ATP-binding protein